MYTICVGKTLCMHTLLVEPTSETISDIYNIDGTSEPSNNRKDQGGQGSIAGLVKAEPCYDAKIVGQACGHEIQTIVVVFHTQPQ